jgi:hypothetical protein
MTRKKESNSIEVHKSTDAAICTPLSNTSGLSNACTLGTSILCTMRTSLRGRGRGFFANEEEEGYGEAVGEGAGGFADKNYCDTFYALWCTR